MKILFNPEWLNSGKARKRSFAQAAARLLLCCCNVVRTFMHNKTSTTNVCVMQWAEKIPCKKWNYRNVEEKRRNTWSSLIKITKIYIIYKKYVTFAQRIPCKKFKSIMWGGKRENIIEILWKLKGGIYYKHNMHSRYPVKMCICNNRSEKQRIKICLEFFGNWKEEYIYNKYLSSYLIYNDIFLIDNLSCSSWHAMPYRVFATE